MLLLPYRGARPRVCLEPVADGWELQLDRPNTEHPKQPENPVAYAPAQWKILSLKIPRC